MIFHTGWRRWFPFVSEAISKVIPLDQIRHIGYSHFEGDEAGAMNEFLAVAPHAVPFASQVGLMTSLNDHADREGRGLADGETFSTGKKTWQWIDTPHVPHGWDCGVLFDQSTSTLLCGDLFTQPGAETKPVTESEILTASEAMRKPMDYYAHSTRTTHDPGASGIAQSHDTRLSAWECLQRRWCCLAARTRCDPRKRTAGGIHLVTSPANAG